MSIDLRIEKIVTHFNQIETWEDRYKEIISLGKNLNEMPKPFVVDENKVKGCQSQVWLFPKESSTSDDIQFYADSDALIAKGLIALVLKVYSGVSCDEVISTPPTFIESIGLKEYLSPNRSNGLLAMIKQIKMYGLAIKMKNS